MGGICVRDAVLSLWYAPPNERPSGRNKSALLLSSYASRFAKAKLDNQSFPGRWRLSSVFPRPPNGAFPLESRVSCSLSPTLTSRNETMDSDLKRSSSEEKGSIDANVYATEAATGAPHTHVKRVMTQRQVSSHEGEEQDWQLTTSFIPQVQMYSIGTLWRRQRFCAFGS